MAVFGPGEDRKLVVAPPQQVLGEIELGADEPLRPRHPVAADQHLAPRPACAYVRETPQRRPEQLGMLDRPRPERAVIRSRSPCAPAACRANAVMLARSMRSFDGCQIG